jgi:putative ABC transport system permease protein
MPRQGQAAVFKALLGHWRRHKIQGFTLVVGLAAATALWTAVQALNVHARTSYADAAQTVEAAQRAAFKPKQGEWIDEAAFAALRRAGFEVTPVVEGRLGSGQQVVNLLGIDPLTYQGFEFDTKAVSGPENMADFISTRGQLIAGPEASGVLETILAKIAPAVRPTVVEGKVLSQGQVLGDIALVQRLLDRRGLISRLLITPNDTRTASDLPSPWNTRLVRVDPPVLVDIEGLTDSFHLNLTAFGLLCFLVGLFIVYSAIGLALEERVSSIRTLRVCGVSLRRLIILLIFEMILIAIVAGAIGVTMGYVIAGILLPDVATSLRGLYGAQVSGELSLNASWWVGGIVISVLGALGASAGAFWQVTRMPLLARQGAQAWHHASLRSIRVKAALAVMCFTLAFLSYQFSSGLIAAFIVMAGLLLGAAFLLPVFLAGVLWLGLSISHKPVSRWFWADSLQQMQGLSLALMALLLALGANIGVGSMVDGFRITFTDFLEERLAPEVYVYTPDDETAKSIAQWLETRSEVTAVLPYWSAESMAFNVPVSVTAYKDHITFRNNWVFVDAAADPWDEMKAGSRILVNEQFARRQNLTVGDSVELAGSVRPFRANIVGIYADYGNPRNDVRVIVDDFDQYWPDGERRRFGLRVDGDTGLLIDEIKQRFDLGANQVINQKSLKAFSTTVFEKTFAVSAALNSLTLGVAGIALLTSLLTLSNARIVNIAPIWAMGVARESISRLELAKVLMLALLTAIAAVPLGIGVAWCLVAVVNVEAFGWRLPLHVFPLQWLNLIALGVFTALIAALYPAIKLMRTSPSQLSKVFAHER